MKDKWIIITSIIDDAATSNDDKADKTMVTMQKLCKDDLWECLLNLDIYCLPLGAY